MPPGYPPQPKSFALPANDIPTKVRDSLNPWIAGFVGLTPQEATDRLHERWNPIESDSLIALRSVLADFEVREIADVGDGGLIYAIRTDAADQSIGNSFYLPGPIDTDVLDGQLDACELSGVEGLREFLLHFGGLAEDITTAGHFVHIESPWPTFTDSCNDSIEGFDGWVNSLMLYHARNGCHLLVRSDGRVAWWVMQEALVQEIALQFTEFVTQFADHRKLAWPYDPYSL